MCSGRPGWRTASLRNYEKEGMTKIYLDLEDIIEVDTKNKVARALGLMGLISVDMEFIIDS
jgi:hypothetical protein